ncbi:hypothetical protein BDQ17DRAFT_556469 [Cyathus striatus]|nr:hypothetical protein BDQ17DRAFT_556469 [Cyathus striatus]
MLFRKQNVKISMLKADHHGDGSDGKKDDKDQNEGADAEEVVSSTSSTGQSSISATSTSFSTSSVFSDSSSTSITVTATSSGLSTPAPSSVLTFNIPGEVATCSSFTIFWNYTGQLLPLTLFIDDGAQYESATSSSLLPPFQPAASHTPLRVLATELPSDVGTYTWKTVDLVGGAYLLDAMSISDVIIHPTLFNVINGTNTTCLAISTTQVHNHHGLAQVDMIALPTRKVRGSYMLY